VWSVWATAWSIDCSRSSAVVQALWAPHAPRHAFVALPERCPQRVTIHTPVVRAWRTRSGAGRAAANRAAQIVDASSEENHRAPRRRGGRRGQRERFRAPLPAATARGADERADELSAIGDESRQ
jgi:hypothetical protein